jgi:serine/threonine-protein kinase RsbT
MPDKDTIPINGEESVLLARVRVRHFIEVQGLEFSTLDRMHILTATSELARNIFMYAKTGTVNVERLTEPKAGIKVVFSDQGPGIPSLQAAMTPKPVTKYSVGMGLGLSGSQRLADEFDIKTMPGQGTTITFIKWQK